MLPSADPYPWPADDPIDMLDPTVPRMSSVAVAPREAPTAVAVPAWRPVVAQAAAMWAGTRVLFIVLTFIAVTLIGNKPVSFTVLLDAWKQWDAGYYLAIAQHGYVVAEDTAFFPLFPLLTAGLSFVLFGHTLLASLIIANLGALAAFIGIALLATHEFGTPEGPVPDDAGWRAVRVAAAYPLAFFLAAPYTESLFLASSVFTLYFARRGQWLWAALLAFLAGLTRPTALILILPLLWEYGRQQGWWQRATWHQGAWRSRLRPAALGKLVLAVGAVPAAVGVFAAYLWYQMGDPLIFEKVQGDVWHRQSVPLWTSLADLGRQIIHPMIVLNGMTLKAGSYWRGLQVIDIGLLLAFLIITIVMIRRMPFAYTLYMFGLAYLTLSVPNPARPEVIQSTARFLVAAFPVFLILSRWTKGRPWLNTLLVDASYAILGIFTIIFLGGGWIE